MMDNIRLIRLREVMQLVPLSKAKIYALIQNGEFPRPKKIGGSSLWSVEEVSNYINNLKN